MAGSGVITDFFKTTARVDKKSKTQNDMGGVVYEYTPRIADLPCRVCNHRNKEADQFGKMTIRETHQGYCSATAATKQITESDRLVIGDQIFEITGIYNPGGLDRHLKLNLERIH
ncbi:MAG: phage head completion protein [Planctomycetota bacterium]|jgi:hypothetical protein